MSETTPRVFPAGFAQGPIQGQNIIGEVTESLHRFLLDGWTFPTPPPRIEEDLSFVPKDREEVVYVFMYRAAQNTSLVNSKQWRPAMLSVPGESNPQTVFYERAPLYLNVFYLIGVHSKFRSEAERLMGWVLMRLYDATHLVYRPRRYMLPSGDVVDSTGRPWAIGNDGGDDLIMEKVSVALVDDLTIGDAINFYTINEAPYRPFLTYRAQCAMEGSLVSGPPTTVRTHRARMVIPEGSPSDRPNGRAAGGRTGTRTISPGQQGKDPGAEPSARPSLQHNIGPPGFGHRPFEDNESED